MQAASGHLPRSGAEELQKCRVFFAVDPSSPCAHGCLFKKEKFLFLLCAQEIRPVAQGEGGVFFLKGELVKEGGREQAETVWGRCFA